MRGVRVAAGVVAVLLLAGCGAPDEDPSTRSPAASTSIEYDPTQYGDPVGPGCAGVPAGEAKGSFTAMRGQSAPDAIADNPLTKNFATALAAEEDLQDQLAKATELTIFVPADTAFAALAASSVTKLLTVAPTRAAMLDYAVVVQQLVPPQLTGSLMVSTLAGADQTLTFSVASGVVLLNGSATVVCSNIVTANATIYLTDKVLLP